MTHNLLMFCDWVDASDSYAKFQTQDLYLFGSGEVFVEHCATYE